ncbi:MAG: hypothetical protein CMO35_02410 [Verrucomicrobiaceae bacterium]|nr:hypothetical protein [Verrucomicrobiaceae bacterium]
MSFQRSASILLGLAACVPAICAQPEIEFNRDIRPILAENCFACHGPDPGARKADMRLDTEAGFFAEQEGAPPVVVKGKPDESELYLRLITEDPDEIMPPPKSHKTLSPEQISLVRTWISMGAPWQAHWSLRTPVRPEVPTPKKAEWPRNSVDNFLLTNLEEKNLSPAPDAAPHVIARRLALDLTGLPPSPETTAGFISAPTEENYLKLVDSLLASPRYGEHRARYWLDAARYGDTHGLHFDNYREMYPYRDWVVKAFNQNLAYDKFTVWQLAGDLLPEPSLDQLIATGFQRCNITTNEGGTIAEENLAIYAADRVQTFGWIYLGLTTNCAQCHDHKFDPFTTNDYYSMAAFFRNTTQGAMDGNASDGRGPVIKVPFNEDREKRESLDRKIAEAQERLENRRTEARPDFEKWAATANPDQLAEAQPRKNLLLHIPLNEGLGDKVKAFLQEGERTFKSRGFLTWDPKGKIGPAPRIKRGRTFDLGDLANFKINQAFSYGAWIRSARGINGAIFARMDESRKHRGWDLWQQGGHFGAHIVDSFPDNALKIITQKAVLKFGQWNHVFVTYDGSGKAEGLRLYHNGVEQPKSVEAGSLKPNADITSETTLQIGQRSNGEFFEDGFLQDMRIYERALSAGEITALADSGPLRAILATAAQDRNAEQNKVLLENFLQTRDTQFSALTQEISNLKSQRQGLNGRAAITHVQKEKQGMAMANILMRGQYDKKGDQLQANTPSALPPLPEDAPRNRLGLARWVVAPENPLTARVTVNRLWQEIFGQGIVVTSEDFGIMGMPPTHPELLDWLAVEFRESGWDVKQFLKLLVTTRAYRQAAITTPEKREKDEDNRFLSRGPRFRMDAEMVRDYALSVSGLLSATMGGPGVRPYQPENIWNVVGLPGGNTRNYKQDTGEKLYRRTLYNFWKRMAHPPNMEAFNAPSREVCTVRRERTNTPLQALVTMNDPQFVEAARALAQGALQSSSGEESVALDYIARRALCRPLRSNEANILRACLDDHMTYYKANLTDAKALIKVGESMADPTLDPRKLAAWTMLCNQVLNLDEVLNK